VLALSAGAARVVVDERGGRIERLEFDGLNLLVPPEADDHDHGAFPMAPWAGRVRHGQFTFDGVEHQLPLNKPPHAIHGIVRDQRWTVTEQSDRTATLRTELGEPWPFGGRVVQRVSLTPGALDLTMEVQATGRMMPASCGWHPWWNRDLERGEPVEVELHATEMYRRDDEDIPTGELGPVTAPPWDDCFTRLGQPAAALHWPGALTVTITTDCPCVVVFTEPERAVCVEPQSGPPDELNLAPHVVQPGAPLAVATTWAWERDR
jgi:aldose 1-epimerase